MALFQKSVINKYIKAESRAIIDEKYAIFAKYFSNPQIQQNIRNSKEEQFQEGFLRELFVNVFGYTLNPEPDFNLTTELKNIANSKKTDGAILRNESAIAVIELKSTSTVDLATIESQAFGYKNNHPSCVYVITSNFEKLRFYINNAVEYLEFNLFDMSIDKFELMYLCLAQKNIFDDVPLKMKQASIMQEEDVTKKLYKDYSAFRNELFRNLVEKNSVTSPIPTVAAPNSTVVSPHPTVNRRDDMDSSSTPRFTVGSMPNSVGTSPDSVGTFPNSVGTFPDSVGSLHKLGASKFDKLTLFKKTQKLLDRFLFIFFAEDRQLLPPNYISSIIKQWDTLKDLDEYVPLYDRFKKHFGYLNTGFRNKQIEVFPYNGGLFAPDDLLDNIEIDDDLLYRHTLNLSKYDFETEIDVNILGHIFENSLTEIESVQAELRGEAVDKQKTKRKKDGIFYTPKYITKYIVDNTLGKLCEEQRRQFRIIDEEYHDNSKKDEKRQLLERLDAYREWLLGVKILDPACGSGAFLNQALEFLIEEHRKLDELKTKLLGGDIVFSDIENQILENNIFGVDLNEESVEIAKLSLWLRTAQRQRKLNSLTNNIKCGNSLIDDPVIAGDKAFSWEKEFPQVFREKEIDKTLQAYHVTWVTFNSRNQDINNYASSVLLDQDDRNTIAEYLDEKINKEKYRIANINVMHDHVHCIIVCGEEELPKIVANLKGYSSYMLHKHSDKINLRVNPEVDDAQYADGTRKKLWAKDYSHTYLNSEELLRNAIEYIANNHAKHNIAPLDYKFNSITPYSELFKPETIKGGFDIIIGNPPYVRSTILSDVEKSYYNSRYYSAHEQYDLYVLFNEKYIELTNQKNYIGIIQPNKFISAEYGKGLKNFLATNAEILTLYNVSLDKVFEGASVYPYIFIYKKVTNQIPSKMIDMDLLEFASNAKLLEFDSNIYLNRNIIEKIKIKSIELKEITGYIKRGMPNNRLMFENKGYKAIKSTMLESPYYDGDQFEYINYIEPNYNKETEFSEELIMLPRTVLHIRASLNTNKYHILDRIYYFNLNVESKNNYKIKYILSILNCQITSFYYEYKYGSTKIGGGYYDLKGTQIETFPIPAISLEAQAPFIEKADIMLAKNKELMEKRNKFFKYFVGQYGIDKPSTKLKEWHKLTFEDFTKELAKLKIKLSATEKFDLMPLFEREQSSIKEIEAIINRTDADIDRMVYNLYELTEEEIKIVEEE